MNSKLLIAILLVLLIISVLVASVIGAVRIDFADLWGMFTQSNPSTEVSRLSAVWLNIRLPRILMAVFVGAGLALSGAAMQGLFRNPLADPSIIGISGGAITMAALTIVLLIPLVASFPDFAGYGLLSIMTFLGAVGSAWLIFSISRSEKKTNVATMLLAGIALNAIAGSFTGLLTYLADDAQLRDLTFWTMGSLAGANYTHVAIVSATLVLASFLVIPEYKAFNALALGEQDAQLIGTDTERLKTKVVVATALMVGVGVAFTGMIAFVGLVVPHIMRLLIGNDHRFLLPASLIVGALLLNITDTVARTVVQPAELPIGVITSLVGAPIFLSLLLHRKKQFAL